MMYFFPRVTSVTEPHERRRARAAILHTSGLLGYFTTVKSGRLLSLTGRCESAVPSHHQDTRAGGSITLAVIVYKFMLCH